jgi:predicted transcriptional regulator YdeE
MKRKLEQLPQIMLVGLTARTNNKDEMNPDTSKIGPLAESFWSNQEGSEIKHRASPGVTYSVYTDYVTDENGEYTYFIGEAVSSFDDQDLAHFNALVIPGSQYMKFTTEPGAMPNVVVQAWQDIWQMTDSMFEGKRKYIADFEVYDQRAADPSNTVIDIYIGTE